MQTPDKEANVSDFMIDVRRYPTLTREEELTVAEKIDCEKQKILENLACFPHFLSYLSQLRAELSRKKIHPQEVFHLNLSGTRISSRQYFFPWLLQQLENMNAVREEWTTTLDQKKDLTDQSSADAD
ncbi:hypothetical protein ACFL27_27790, partial [candidate division CSSED10-310 bacterium]